MKDREAFNAKVARFLRNASQCMDGDAAELGHELVYELALFYSDRKILTRLYCSACGYEGDPDEEEVLPNGACEEGDEVNEQERAKICKDVARRIRSGYIAQWEVLADVCPKCKETGHMCSYTEKQWKKKCEEWGNVYYR